MTPIETNSETTFSESQASIGTFRDAQEENAVGLVDLALILALRKGFIFLWGFFAAVVTAILVLIVPVTFTATTTMLPPQKENSASMILGQIGGLASLVGGGGGAASMLGLKNPADLYIGLLQSQTVEDGIVNQLHLKKRYKAKRQSDARNALKGRTKIVAEKSSLISISVKSHDPKEAALIANAYVAHLHLLLSHLSVTEAAQRRAFFAQQAEEEKNKLADAEVALEETEQKTGIIQPQGQAQAVIATIMQLRAQISASEVELAELRTSATDQNSQVITLQSQIAGLKAQLSDFEKGHPGAAAVAGNVLTPTTQVPAASLEYIRKMRDVRYHETLYEFMARQYEMARVDEAKQGQVIQVVDPALVPDRKSWPPRTLLTLLAFVLGILFSSFWVLMRTSYQQKILKDPELKAKSYRLREALRLRRTIRP